MPNPAHGLLAAALLAPLAYATPASAAPAAAVCTSTSKPALATRLSDHIQQALQGRAGTVSVSVVDTVRGVRCDLGASRKQDSASVIKVTVLGTLLRRAQEEKRALTQTESDRARLMVTRSDNDATTALWDQLGTARIRKFFQLVGMDDASFDPGGWWGKTQITTRDQIKLLTLLTRPGSVLTDTSRQYALKLMAEVVADQRWGAPAGAPSGVKVYVKNGWAPRETHQWRINSIAAFTGGGRDYRIAMLSQDNATMAYGVATLERVAKAIHQDLAAG